MIAGVDQGGDGEPAAGGLSRERDVRGRAAVQEGFVGRKSVVDRGRIRVLGGEPVVDGDDLGAGPPADLRGQVGGEEGVPHHVHAAVEVENNVARFDPVDRDLGRSGRRPARLRSRSRRQAAAAPTATRGTVAVARRLAVRRGRLTVAGSRRGSLAVRCSRRISFRSVGFAASRDQGCVGKANEVGAGERGADLLHLAAGDQVAEVDREEARVLK